tara:strand:- start:662 stop:1111 length:450 start_codon:yes stop_codon:yes gene_type:complete
MFQVFLLRHAKSSWDNLNISDIDRPLNKRGIKNAKKLAIYLRNKPIEIEKVICSPSARTINTYNLIKKSLNKDHHFITDQSIYECNENILTKLIKKINKNTLIIGHNPSITESLNKICKTKIGNIATCTLVKIIKENKYFLSDIIKPVK